MLLSVVLPAHNEDAGVGPTVLSVPIDALRALGWDTEIVVVDNASTDATAEVAAASGARVAHEAAKGYGNAIRRGYAVAEGDVLVTADADGTYPMDLLPSLVGYMEATGAKFITTCRYNPMVNGTFSRRSRIGTWALTVAGRVLGGPAVKDSQSGMWLITRDLLRALDMTGTGMELSQEIKAKAIRAAGKAWAELPIPYLERAGASKLRPFQDGVRCLMAMAVRR